jgi:hypothetical protein
VRDLGLVQRREHGEHADADARDEAAREHAPEVLRGRLQGAADEEDEAAEDDRPPAPDGVFRDVSMWREGWKRT